MSSRVIEPPKDLAALQREMAAAVMQPLNSDEGMQVTAADGRAMTAVAESFIAPNSRLTSFERLEIYNRQYWFRVLGSLAEDFPGLRAVVGGRRFETLSIAYLKEHPSRSFTLRNLGVEACRLARRASRSCRPPASPCRRCGAHRMGFRRGLRFGGARAAHARSDRYPRWTFPAQPSAAPESYGARLSC